MKADLQTHLIDVQSDKKNQKKRIHLISKYNSHLSICGIEMSKTLLDDANHFTKAKLDVTCGNCLKKMNIDIEIERIKRYLRGHTANQTNLEDMF